MKRRRMGVEPRRVVPARFFSRIEQQSNNLGMTELSCQSQGSMGILRNCTRGEPWSPLKSPESRHHGQIDSGTPAKQCVCGLELSMRRHGAVGIGSVFAKQI